VEVRRLTNDEEIASCLDVLRQLRPGLTRESLIEFIRTHDDAGYRLVALESAGQIVGVAGYRVLESLGHGRLLFLDDFVTDAGLRSRGHGAVLLDWIEREAAKLGCGTIELDSGVKREGSHRFYQQQGYTIASHHYAKAVEGGGAGREERSS
jgi:GNAT superfamily N-acetyltransferase